MEQEKIKDIKKGLECCYSLNLRECRKCPYGDIEDCKHDQLMQDVITLINELESENERLNKSEIGELIKENEDMAKQCEDWCEITLKKRNQIVELKDRIAELEKEKTCVWEEWTDGYHSIWCCSNCKEDFCFMEGDVYENNYGYCPHCGAKITALKELKEDDIDETLKEFINEQ